MTGVSRRFIAYIRVSTAKQGQSGLGLEAQQEAVRRFVETAGGAVVAEYREVESGKKTDRPELARALAACRAEGATLLVAKLDRLSRNTRFLLDIVEGSGEAGVAFCDLPQLPPGPMGKFFVTLMSAIAELEGGLISARTKAALAAAKARGVKLGAHRPGHGNLKALQLARVARTAAAAEHAKLVSPYISAAKRAGATTHRAIAEALTARGVRTARGGTAWHPSGVQAVLRSLSA